MQVLIDIPEEIYHDIKIGNTRSYSIRNTAIYAIEKGTPLTTGYWITEDMFDGDVAYRCSECNELFWIECGTPKDNEYNFCPKCGKRLVEPQES